MKPKSKSCLLRLALPSFSITICTGSSAFDDNGFEKSSVKYRARGVIVGVGPKKTGFLSLILSGGLCFRRLSC